MGLGGQGSYCFLETFGSLAGDMTAFMRGSWWYYQTLPFGGILDTFWSLWKDSSLAFGVESDPAFMTLKCSWEKGVYVWVEVSFCRGSSFSLLGPFCKFFRLLDRSRDLFVTYYSEIYTDLQHFWALIPSLCLLLFLCLCIKLMPSAGWFQFLQVESCVTEQFQIVSKLFSFQKLLF